jgi:hypothetical protein
MLEIVELFGWVALVAFVTSLLILLRPFFSTLAEFKASLIVVVLAFLIYQTPQMRDVLWIQYCANGEGANSSLNWQSAFDLVGTMSSKTWSFSSILMLTVALRSWVPGSSYNFATVWDLAREAFGKNNYEPLEELLILPGWSLSNFFWVGL